MKIKIIIILITMAALSSFPHERQAVLAETPAETIQSEHAAQNEDDTDRTGKTGSASLVRLAWGGFGMLTMMDRDLDFYYDQGFGFIIDFFPYRLREWGGNGFDLFVRAGYRYYWTTNEVYEREDDFVYEDNTLHMFSLDVGIRAVYGAYFLGQLWQAYVLAAPRYLYFQSEGKNSRYGYGHPDSVTRLNSIGFIGGLGLEVTIFRFMGIFIEMNVGYTPVGESERNVEGIQLYLGLTYRNGVRPGWW